MKIDTASGNFRRKVSAPWTSIVHNNGFTFFIPGVSQLRHRSSIEVVVNGRPLDKEIFSPERLEIHRGMTK